MTPETIGVVVAAFCSGGFVLGFYVRGLVDRCMHRWEIIDGSPIYRGDPTNTIGMLVTLQCSECGDVKSKRVTP